MQPAERADMSSPVKELEFMLSTIAKGVVDSPDDVVVFAAAGPDFVHFEVRTDNRDVGTLVGRRGSHAEAIRLLMMAAGAVRGYRVTLQIMSRDGDDALAGR